MEKDESLMANTNVNMQTTNASWFDSRPEKFLYRVSPSKHLRSACKIRHERAEVAVKGICGFRIHITTLITAAASARSSEQCGRTSFAGRVSLSFSTTLNCKHETRGMRTSCNVRASVIPARILTWNESSPERVEFELSDTLCIDNLWRGTLRCCLVMISVNLNISGELRFNSAQFIR